MNKYTPLKLEKEIQTFWKKNKIYEKQSRGKGKPFYFLQGPPYTSGYFHIGSILNNILKDMVLKYKKIRGFDVWDRAGWDMHGLPTANATMKELKLKNKDDIEEYGIEKFVKACKKTATKYLHKMEDDLLRTAIWMDLKNAYMPITNEFMESVWWVLKQADNKGRIYRGLKVMTWCANCATAVAKHELEYETDKEESIFLKFRVKGKKNEFLVIWTTTPWTIPFNLAVMVNPDVEYVRAKVGNEIWIIASQLAGLFLGSIDKKYNVLSSFKGQDIEGLEYEHPMESKLRVLRDIKRKHPNAFTVLLSKEYVDTSAGSGLVHCAPGCGPEDQEVGRAYDIPPFNELDEEGKFSTFMGNFAGWEAKTDDAKFIEVFRKGGYLINTAEVEHEYAHCWRCHEPVVFRATKQWFLKVEDLKEKMRLLNKKVNWVPKWAGANAFDSWLDNLKDNSITRQRYWGTPAPIWRCSKCKDYTVVGSIKELKKLTKDKIPKDIHLPWIDKVEIKCKCGGVKKRIPDIIDVWIDSGATSFACLEYPHRSDYFKRYWPADFILEALEQVRLWFNTLVLCSMVSTGRFPYKTVYVHGMINDQKGRKMSKSLGNYISPYEVIDKYGADTLRYYFTGGSNPGQEFKYSDADANIKYRNLGVLWNTAKYLSELEYKKPSRLGEKDKYMLSRLNNTIASVTKCMEKYRLNEVPLLIEELFLELSRWYIKATRDEDSSYVIYKTLFSVVRMFSLVAPFISEKIYQQVFRGREKKESILLFDWLKFEKKFVNRKLEEDIQVVQQVVSAVLASREQLNRGIRWPVKKVVVTSRSAKVRTSVKKHVEMIKQMTNCLSVEISEKLEGAKYTVKPDYKKLGPKLGGRIKEFASSLSKLSAGKVTSELERKGKIIVNGIEASKEELVVREELPSGIVGAWEREFSVYLDTSESSEMIDMGFAREIVRKIQDLRRKAGLVKKDRISLTVEFRKVKIDKAKIGASSVKFGKVRGKRSLKFKVKGEKVKIGF